MTKMLQSECCYLLLHYMCKYPTMATLLAGLHNRAALEPCYHQAYIQVGPCLSMTCMMPLCSLHRCVGSWGSVFR